MKSKDITQHLDVGRVQVLRWRERYAQFRLAGIERDLPRAAPPATVDVALTTQSKPEAATHRSTRTMRSAGHQRRQRVASLARQWTQTTHRSRFQCVAGF